MRRLELWRAKRDLLLERNAAAIDIFSVLWAAGLIVCPYARPQVVGGALANSFIQMSAQDQASLDSQGISVSASASASYGAACVLYA